MYKEYERKINGKTISVKLLTTNVEEEKYKKWEPEFLEVCAERGMKTLFVGHRNHGIEMDFERDAMYVFCNPRDTMINPMFHSKLDKVFSIEGSQYDKCVVRRSDVNGETGYTIRNAVGFKNNFDVFCYYLLMENVFMVSDLYHTGDGLGIMKYVSKLIETNSYPVVDSNYDVESIVERNSIYIADKKDVEELVKANTENFTRAVDARLKVKIAEMNQIIKEERGKNMTIPEFINNDRYKVLKFVSDGIVNMGIATYISFRVNRIYSESEAYDVGGLTHIKNVWVCVMLNNEKRVTGIRLYNKTFTRIFNHPHHKPSSFDEREILCMGSFQDRISDITVTSSDEYGKVIEVVKQMLSTIDGNDIEEGEEDMEDECELLGRIEEGDEELMELKLDKTCWSTR